MFVFILCLTFVLLSYGYCFSSTGLISILGPPLGGQFGSLTPVPRNSGRNMNYSQLPHALTSLLTGRVLADPLSMKKKLVNKKESQLLTLSKNAG